MQILPSGLQRPEGTDNVNRANEVANIDKLDELLRPYHEEVDTETKDAAAGVYTTVRYKRDDGTVYMRAVLSNKVNGYYTTDTWTFYAADGTTVVKSRTWTLTYDADGIVINKQYVDS